LESRALKQASRAWRGVLAVMTQPGPRLAPHHQDQDPGAWWESPIPLSSRRAADTKKKANNYLKARRKRKKLE